MIKKIKDFILRIFKILSRPEMLVLPGQLAYFFLLAMVPTITMIAYGASLFHLSLDFLTNFITKAFSADLATLIVPIVSNVKISPQFIITLCVGFYAASTGASSIIITSNEMYDIPNTSFIKRKIKAIFMTLILVFLFLFLLLIPVFGTKITDIIQYVNMNPVITKTAVFMINLMKGPISWFIVFFLIKVIYTMAPDKELSSCNTNYGSLFCTFGFVLATMVYSFYVNYFANYVTLYGGLAQFVILMVWLYILATIFVIGLAINAQQLEKIGEITEE